MELLAYLVAGIIIGFAVRMLSNKQLTKGDKVYRYIDEVYGDTDDIDAYIGVHNNLVKHFKLTDDQAQACMRNYKRGLPWFKTQSFLMD